ncbi:MULTISPECIES: CpsD/CapB family tyrosine-protein kinase [Listeria]|uniref:CpsD/CapB family tyrosine-protein kinase n=1 Tax=Listeria TaxID=1637 RepID=UPI000B5882AF|nr:MULTISPECIES: CpsD/CapB family tyrosine-protein kinase [Listeria]
MNFKQKSFGGRKILLNAENASSVFAEQIRAIRTNTQFSSAETLKSLVVTSPEPSTGKSFISANLALSFADQGYQVLLVDTDLRRPAVHKYLHLINTTGVSNFLTGQELLEDCIRETAHENLYAITSGVIPPNPAELLSSSRMKQFVQTISSMFDMVIFDAPPVLPVVDPLLIANLVDGVIFNLRSGYSEGQAAVKSLEKIKQAGGRVIGAVLNDKKATGTKYEEAYYGLAETN